MFKKILTMLVLALCGLAVQAQVEIPRQEIHYNVNYRWGIIDIMIARGVVTVETDGNRLIGTLDGTSIPWEGHVICVSDTLYANMNIQDGRVSENVEYQNGWYRHPKVSQFRSSNYNPDDPAQYKSISGAGNYNASRDSMEAITVTSDMLGMYYFAHVLDFEHMQPGERVVIPIEDGYAREVVITYQGPGVYNDSNSSYRTYDCTFEYSYDGAMSGYEVQCRIGVDDRIPKYLSASLPVGHVEMLYDGE